jgi:hypothetical protein
VLEVVMEEMDELDSLAIKMAHFTLENTIVLSPAYSTKKVSRQIDDKVTT